LPVHKVTVYEIESGHWTLIKSADDNYEQEIYGTVEMGFVNSPGTVYSRETVWNRSEYPGGRVLAEKGKRETFNPVKRLRCIVDPQKEQASKSYSFFLSATLYDWSDSGQDDCIGSGSNYISFPAVSTNSLQELKLEFRKGSKY
jgi:hypothetical protein